MGGVCAGQWTLEVVEEMTTNNVSDLVFQTHLLHRSCHRLGNKTNFNPPLRIYEQCDRCTLNRCMFFKCIPLSAIRHETLTPHFCEIASCMIARSATPRSRYVSPFNALPKIIPPRRSIQGTASLVRAGEVTGVLVWAVTYISTAAGSLLSIPST